MRILVIEDDINLAKVMKKGLEQEGFNVDVSNLGEEGEQLAYVEQYDAILLDLNLPDKDGISILKFLRSEDVDTPVIIITARDEIKQRALGLDVGADDYVIKPFDFIEVIARIRAVVRRFQGRANPKIIIGNMEIDPKSKTTKIGAKQVNLSVKEFEILEYLAISYPNTATNEQISDYIYGEEVLIGSSVLRVHIGNLRKKIKQGTGKPIIETIKGRGYKICLAEKQDS
ncbi:MAG: response regulator transcription factor [Culicoidibacterales bacterium]